MISAAAIDHFGLFGAQVSPLTLTRAGGISLMAAGLWIIQKA
jgi:transporter family-2 protein